jgi:uncharacterized membrane protein
MDSKTFSIYKIVIAGVLGMLIGSAVVIGNFIIPIIAVAAAWIIMYTLKKKVKGVLSDERIEKVAGKASYMTYMIMTLAMTLTGIVLMAMKAKLPYFEPVAYTLVYLACGMMLLYSLLFRIYYSRGE